MNFRRFTFWLVFICYWCNGSAIEEKTLENECNQDNARKNVKSTYALLSQSISQVFEEENFETCSSDDDATCFSTNTQDTLGLEAIAALHHQLDDDRDGNVDLNESDDFLRGELKYDSGCEKRQKAFHQNDDTHISVKELWDAWLRSEVHNWTIQQTSEWLAISVELPQYVNNFLYHKITGSMLPRLAVDNMKLLNTLRIKDPIHKQKIALKAMDVVLFGPPKDNHPYWKDFTLIILIVGVSVGMWYAHQQNNKFKNHLNRMNKDMESLQRAESALGKLKKEHELALRARENAETAEIETLRRELEIAEEELRDRSWSPPLVLQHWLQLTHEIENKSYVKKIMLAGKQLQNAKDACEKLRKKGSNFIGAFISTHGKSMDDVDRSTVEAHTSLNEVTHESKERAHRWKQIEMLCGFNITNNSGLQQLESVLYRNANINSSYSVGTRERISSVDNSNDDTRSILTGATE